MLICSIRSSYDIFFKNYAAGDKNVVKGCVSRSFNHATFDHVFWPAD